MWPKNELFFTFFSYFKSTSLFGRKCLFHKLIMRCVYVCLTPYICHVAQLLLRTKRLGKFTRNANQIIG